MRINCCTILVVFFITGAGMACAPAVIPPNVSLHAREKIKFSIEEIDEQGLIGPADGKRLIAYKFSIPADRAKRREVRRIDPSIKFFLESDSTQYNCIGEGATQQVLLKLAGLTYIARIDPFYGE
jgi:hypothetical protein